MKEGVDVDVSIIIFTCALYMLSFVFIIVFSSIHFTPQDSRTGQLQ